MMWAYAAKSIEFQPLKNGLCKAVRAASKFVAQVANFSAQDTEKFQSKITLVYT